MPQASCCQLIWPVIRLNLSRASHFLATLPANRWKFNFMKPPPCTVRPSIHNSPPPSSAAFTFAGSAGEEKRRNFTRSILLFIFSFLPQKFETFGHGGSAVPATLQLGRIKSLLCHVKMDSPRNITKSYLTAALIEMMDNTGARDDWRQLDFTHIM